MFLIFSLENCIFCQKAINILEKKNLIYTIYQVKDKEIARKMIIHLLILSNFLELIDKKKYILGIQNKRNDLKDQIIEKAKIKKGIITFPQIFVMNEIAVQSICNNENIITEDILYVGDSSELISKLQ